MLRQRLPSSSALFIFEAAARTGNFSRAADELGISQPAVSRAVAALEEHLGRELFVRNGPRLGLTESGAALSRVATSAFAAIDHVIADWEERDPDRDTVLLSISSAMATHWLIPRLGEFRERFPSVDLRFELIPGGVGGPLNKCDLGLRVVDPLKWRKTESLYIEERIQAIGSPAYLREHGTLEHPVAGRRHTLIALSDHWCTWQEYAARTGIRLPSNVQVLTFADYSVVLQTAATGQGLALGWISVTSKLLLDGVLRAASDACLTTGKQYHLIGPSTRPMRAVARQVRDWMVDLMRRDVALLRERQRHDANGPWLSLGDSDSMPQAGNTSHPSRLRRGIQL